MVTSVTEIPHGWMMIEADATNLVKTRNHHKNAFKQNEGYNLTFFAFFVKAVADALKAHPLLNSTWQGEEIVIHKDINISIAVADKDKLYVPVIKHADEKSIKGIAREINDLANKARHGQLTQKIWKAVHLLSIIQVRLVLYLLWVLLTTLKLRYYKLSLWLKARCHR